MITFKTMILTANSDEILGLTDPRRGMVSVLLGPWPASGERQGGPVPVGRS